MTSTHRWTSTAAISAGMWLGVTSFSMTFTAPTQASVGNARISVGVNVQVSAAMPEWPHYEVWIDAALDGSGTLVACGMTGWLTPDTKYAVYTSRDFGRTWRLTAVRPPRDRTETAVDPSCVAGSAGVAAAVALVDDPGPAPTTIDALYSDDYGLTWRASTLPGGTRSLVDRPYVLIDTTDGPYRGRVYLHAHEHTRRLDGTLNADRAYLLWRSKDGGRTFEGPVSAQLKAFNGDNATLLSDGTFVALIRRYDRLESGNRWDGSLHVLRSTDGGVSLEGPFAVGEVHDGVPGTARFDDTTFGKQMIARDGSSGPFRDRLYAVWADNRFDKRIQIVLSSSDDGGKTWSPARLVSDGPHLTRGGKRSSAFLPAIAVNKHGVVSVSWYDRRENRGNDLDYDVRFAASLDGGQTFGPSVAVSTAPRTVGADERWLPYDAMFRQLRTPQSRQPERVKVDIRRVQWLTAGHTAGLAADSEGVFHVLWVDNRSGIDQMWTAPVSVAGSAIRNGVPFLRSFADITTRCVLRVAAVRFDEPHRRLIVTVRLENVSKEPIRGLVLLKATRLESPIGHVKSSNADAALQQAGDVWRLLDKGTAQTIEPGSLGMPVDLEFTFTDLKTSPFVDDGVFNPAWLQLEGQILAATADTVASELPTYQRP